MEVDTPRPVVFLTKHIPFGQFVTARSCTQSLATPNTVYCLNAVITVQWDRAFSFLHLGSEQALLFGTQSLLVG